MSYPGFLPGGDATVSVAVGSTTTSLPGSDADVTNSGTPQAVVLNFTIPRGPEGPEGPAGASASVAVGTTTTGAAGSDASVSNSGDAQNVVLNFTIPRGAEGPAGTVPDPLSLYELQTRQVQAYPTDNPSTLLLNGDSVAGNGKVVVNASSEDGITLTALGGPIVFQAGTGIYMTSSELAWNNTVFSPQRQSGSLMFSGPCWHNGPIFAGYEYMTFGSLNILWIQPVMGHPGGASGVPSATWPTGIPLPPQSTEGDYPVPCMVRDVIDKSVTPAVFGNFAGQCRVVIDTQIGGPAIQFGSSCNGTKSDHDMNAFNQPGFDSVLLWIGAYATQIVWFST